MYNKVNPIWSCITLLSIPSKLYYCIIIYINSINIIIINDENRLFAQFNVADFTFSITKYLFHLVHRPRSALIFVNPEAGTKNSLKVLTEVVEPLLDMARVTPDIIGK